MSRWKVILEDVIADRRQAMGEKPSIDVLVDAREGRLSTDEREQLLERAAVDPELARELLDVLDFPSLPADLEDERESADEKWRRFEARLQLAEDDDAETKEDTFSAGARQGSRQRSVPSDRQPLGRRPSFQWGRLAAASLVGVLVGAVGHQLVVPGQSADAPPVVASGLGNVEVVPLAIDDAPGSRGGDVKVGTSAEWLLLTLGTARLPAAESYGLRLVDASGREVWRQAGLVPLGGGLLTAAVPTGSLRAGGYRVFIHPGGDFEREAAATATWNLAAPAP